MDYHQREVNIHNVYDQKLIGHVRYRQHPNENSSGGAKPTDGSQHEGHTKLVRIIGSSEEGSWKEVMFTRVQLVAESACHRAVIELILWKTRISNYGLRDGLK
jgi:hypothetical protein